MIAWDLAAAEYPVPGCTDQAARKNALPEVVVNPQNGCVVKKKAAV